MATLQSLERRVLEAVQAITDEGEEATTAAVDERLGDVEARVDEPLERLTDQGLLTASEAESAVGPAYTLTEAGWAALDEPGD